MNNKEHNRSHSDCDHEHENCNHNHHDCCENDHDHNGIESHMHDGAIVVSANVEISGNVESIKERLKIELESLGRWVESQSGIIGHIKAYVEGRGFGTMMSTTGREVQCKTVANTIVHVNIAAIVYSVMIAEVECRVADIIQKIKL